MRALLGTTEFTLRLLPAVFGVLCVHAIYLSGRLLFNRTVGLSAAFFMAVNPFAVFYSQDARPYTLFLWAAITAVYFSVKLAQQPRILYAAGLTGFSVIALYTHPFAVFLLPVLPTAFGIYWRQQEPHIQNHALQLFLYSCGASAVLFSPQIYRLAALFIHKVESNTVASWITAPTLDTLRQLLVEYFMFKPAAYIFSLIPIAALIYKKVIPRSDRAGWLLVWSIVLFCVVVPWAVSILVTPIYVHRYTIPGLAAAVLLLAWGVSVFPRTVRSVILTIVTGLTAWPLLHYYTGADKDPWRETAYILRKNLQACDLVVAYPPYNSHAVELYLPANEIENLSCGTTSSLPLSIPDGCRRIWFVQAYGSEASSQMRAMESILTEQGEADTVITVRDLIHKNPYAYFIADIQLKRFTLRQSG